MLIILNIAYVPQALTSVGSVIMIAINDENQVLLQKEYSYPPNEVMWQLPGGAMEEGESISEAANRELAEESGFKANTLEEIGFFYTNNRRSNQKQHIVICRDLYPCKLPEDDDEFIETHWLPIQQVHKMIARGEFVNINLLAALNQWFHQGGLDIQDQA